MEDEFVEHAITWYKGELFEARTFLLFGIFFLIITFLLWKFGLSLNARILTLPVLMLGLLFTAIGILGNWTNLKHIHGSHTAFTSDPKKFILEEQQRTKKVMKIYAPVRYALCGLMIVSIMLFLTSTAPSIWKGIAIVLITGGLSILIGDYFSEERTGVYDSYIRSVALPKSSEH